MRFHSNSAPPSGRIHGPFFTYIVDLNIAGIACILIVLHGLIHFLVLGHAVAEVFQRLLRVLVGVIVIRELSAHPERERESNQKQGTEASSE